MNTIHRKSSQIGLKEENNEKEINVEEFDDKFQALQQENEAL